LREKKLTLMRNFGECRSISGYCRSAVLWSVLVEGLIDKVSFTRRIR